MNTEIKGMELRGLVRCSDLYQQGKDWTSHTMAEELSVPALNIQRIITNMVTSGEIVKVSEDTYRNPYVKHWLTKRRLAEPVPDPQHEEAYKAWRLFK